MRRLYRMSLGCFFLGVFLTNGVIYALAEEPSVWGGVVSMASWILAWLFFHIGHGKQLSETEKLFAGFSMGIAACYLLSHIFIGISIPEHMLPVLFFLTGWFCVGAMILGLWWSEVSPPE